MFTQGHALVIGVGMYQHVPSWSFPVTANDAGAVAAILGDESICGYPAAQVTLLRNQSASRDGVLAALDALKGAEDRTVFLFYCGHGHYDAEGTYYLTTSDTRLAADGSVEKGSGVSEAELLARLKAIGAKRVICIFNACHAGAVSPTLGQAAPIGTPPPARTVDAMLGTGEGRIIITACREKQVSFTGTGSLTIFTEALVDGLEGAGATSRNGYISAFDLYTHLYDAITQGLPQKVDAALLQQYGGTQEPELTILKGVGPFAVALFKGAQTLGGDVPADAPPKKAAVREVNRAYSKAQFAEIVQSGPFAGSTNTTTQSGGVNFGQGNSIGTVGDVAGRDQYNVRRSPGAIINPSGSVSQNFGTQRNTTINGSGNNLVEGDQTITGSNVNIGSTLNNVNQSIGAIASADAATRQELEKLFDQLRAALESIPKEHADAAEAVGSYAKDAIDEAAKEKPNKTKGKISLDGLKHAAANIEGVLPSVFKVAGSIAALIGKLALF